MNNNNTLKLSGLLQTMEYSHATKGEDFFKATVCVQRASGTDDILNLIIPSILAQNLTVGKEYGFNGSLRTRNNRDGEKTTLEVFGFITEVFDYPGYDINEIELNGFLCKAPVYRKTPLGREIVDILVATNRGFGKSDYIPCIAWGRSAERISNLEVGSQMIVCGRLQSRTYNKKISDDEYVEKTAFEVSTRIFELVEEENGSKLEEDR